MQERMCRRSFLICFLFLFCCLVLTGGKRLIGNQYDENQASIPALNLIVDEAYLCSLPSINQETDKSNINHEKTLHSRLSLMAVDSVRGQRRPELQADANGNILGEKSYMRTVYQTFALGDGFV